MDKLLEYIKKHLIEHLIEARSQERGACLIVIQEGTEPMETLRATCKAHNWIAHLFIDSPTEASLKIVEETKLC